MKPQFLKFILTCLLTLSSSAAFSQHGPIASGGTPPTAFELTSEALGDILSPAAEPRQVLRHAGAIVRIEPLPNQKQIVFRITTERCAVDVSWVRACPGGNPFACTAKVSVINKMGNCGN